MRRSLLVSAVATVFASGALLAQTGTVSGRVTSAGDGNPVPGVTILIPGTSAGALTKDDGRYSLTVNAGT